MAIRTNEQSNGISINLLNFTFKKICMYFLKYPIMIQVELILKSMLTYLINKKINKHKSSYERISQKTFHNGMTFLS